MKRYSLIPLCCFVFVLSLISCKNEDNNKEVDKGETTTPQLKEENVEYKIDTLNINNYVVYDENMKGQRPAVLVVHEWWGLNDYPKSRARMLAEMGYIAMAVDMYGNG